MLGQKVNDISRFNADIFAIGDDWIGKFDHLKEHANVVYLPRTDDISTTELKSGLFNQQQEKINGLRNLLEKAHYMMDEIDPLASTATTLHLVK